MRIQRYLYQILTGKARPCTIVAPPLHRFNAIDASKRLGTPRGRTPLPFEERVYRESASRPLETDAFGPRKRLYLPARTSSSAISRSLNFCTFMDGVIGKSSTKKTRLGTL